MERPEKRRIVEALVLAAPEPISAARIAEIIPYAKPKLVNELVEELNREYEKQDRSFEIWEVAGGYQVRTRAEFSGYLQKLQKQRPLRLSRAAIETLSIVAYRQPVTRAEIEDVRGVDVGAVLKSLMERQLVRIVGQREVPGRPMIFATTRRFLEVFGLDSLKGLPNLREIDDMARENGVDLGGEDPDAQEQAGASSDVLPVDDLAAAASLTEGDADPEPRETAVVAAEIENGDNGSAELSEEARESGS